MTQALTSPERALRQLVGSTIAAIAASTALIFFASDPIDLESVVPWGPNPSIGAEGRGRALAILVALPVLAAVPVVLRRSWRWRMSVLVFAIMSAFVLLSINRVGILYLPSAWMLGLASRREPIAEVAAAD